MRRFQQLIFSCLMLRNRKHNTKKPPMGKSLIFFISNTENQFTRTTTWACFMFSHFISTELKPLQTFPAVSSCPTRDLECALRDACRVLEMKAAGWKRGAWSTLAEEAFCSNGEGSVLWWAQWMYRGYTGLRDTFSGSLFPKTHLYVMSSWWLSSTCFKGIDLKGFLM